MDYANSSLYWILNFFRTKMISFEGKGRVKFFDEKNAKLEICDVKTVSVHIDYCTVMHTCI